MPKRILEGMTPEKRQRLGPLRNLTVQPGTRKRYDRAIDDFLKFLKFNQLSLPKQREKLDGLVCEFIEHLWSSGQGRAHGSDCVAGLQDMDPKIRGHLPGAWRLLKTWAVNEIPNRVHYVGGQSLSSTLPLPFPSSSGFTGCSVLVSSLKSGEKTLWLKVTAGALFYPWGLLRAANVLGLLKVWCWVMIPSPVLCFIG